MKAPTTYNVTLSDGSRQRLKIADVYAYEADSPFFIGRTERDREGQKHFPSWRADSADPQRYVMNLEGVTRVLYHEPQVCAAAQAAGTIYLAEGEKAAEALADVLGVVATTNPHGAGKWRDEYRTSLDGAALVVLLPDNDDVGRRHMRQAAESLTKVGIPHITLELPDLPEKGDAVEWIAAGGTLEELERLTTAALEAKAKPWAAIEALPDRPETVALGQASSAFAAAYLDLNALDQELAHSTVVRLLKDRHVPRPGEVIKAALAQVHHEEAMRQVAELQALAARVAVANKETSEVPLPPLADLLEGVLATLKRYVAFPIAAAIAVALWTAHTHLEGYETSPYLAIISPERRSGKTRLLDVLDLLVARAWRAITPSEAVLFRKIDADRPTLLLDEVDTIFGPKAPATSEGLRAILNAGNRAGTTVPRCIGDGANMEVQNFSVFCPKAMAGIGKLPDTVADRAVTIRMARRAPGEQVARFRCREAEEATRPLHDDLARWGLRTELSDARPEIPVELDDRAADAWEILLAIADAAGGEWPQRARHAAHALSAERGEDGESLGVRLLADCRSVFEGAEVLVNLDGAEFLATEVLLAGLRAVEEAPWSDLNGKPLSPTKLAAMLRPYGIKPDHIRVGQKTHRGYLRVSFADAWSRYPVSNPAHPAQLPICSQNTSSQPGTQDETVPSQKMPLCRDVPGVPGQTAIVARDENRSCLGCAENDDSQPTDAREAEAPGKADHLDGGWTVDPRELLPPALAYLQAAPGHATLGGLQNTLGISRARAIELADILQQRGVIRARQTERLHPIGDQLSVVPVANAGGVEDTSGDDAPAALWSEEEVTL